MVLIKNLVIAIVGIAVAIVLYTVFTSGMMPKPESTKAVATTTPPIEEVNEITYQNDTFGIAFTYPEGYVMKQTEAGNAERRHTTITLIPAGYIIPEGGEGPPAVSIDFYQSDDAMSLSDWLSTADSNYKLGIGMIASTSLSGIEAVEYQWSGLYMAETTAFLHKDNVVAISATYLSPEDQNVAVYRNLLHSLVLH